MDRSSLEAILKLMIALSFLEISQGSVMTNKIGIDTWREVHELTLLLEKSDPNQVSASAESAFQCQVSSK